jgi:glycosyltransferase involved in cell wall biosynthesis
MRLLHVVPTYLPARRYGGPIVAVHGLCRALAARGHEVEVYTTSIDGPHDSPVPHHEPVMLDGVKVRYFASPRLRRLSYAPALGRALRGAMAGCDVVHLHSVFLWPTWQAARSAQAANVPYVISPRGMLVKRLIESRSRFIKTAWIALIERSNLERAAAVHLTSEVERREIEKFGWRLRRTIVAANAVEDADGAVRNAPSADIAALGGGEPLVVFFGRLARVKGLDRLLRAFAQTEHGILAIVGADYEGLVEELLRLADALHIRHRVRLVTRIVTGADKEHVFAAARVLVLPSYSESFGNTVLEALQRGVPAIVTPEVGAAEIVVQSGGGLVVDGAAEPLGAALASLLDDPARAAAMGEAGRQYVQRHYSWQSVAGRMETLYQELCIAPRV